MIRLNKEITTISGELVTPYLVEGKNVYCWNKAGNTVAKTMNDFTPTSVAIEQMVGGASVVSVAPVYHKTPIITTIETEVFRPVLEESITNPESSTEDASTITLIETGPMAVVSSPDETENDKITYVHVKPAIDDYLEDGELQVGGVEVVTAEEAENRIEFIPTIDDDDYI